MMKLPLVPVLLLAAAAVPLSAQCTYSVSPLTFNADAGSVTGSITGSATVTAPAGCAWIAQSTVSWVTVNVGQSGSGNGTVGWSVDRNPLPAARTGAIAVAGQTITINQAAAVCTYTLAPPSANIPVGGGKFSFLVKTGCAWGTDNTPYMWITVAANTGGIVDGPVNYSVDPNPCVAGRSGAILVGLSTSQSSTFQVNQDGSNNNLAISPASAALSAAATDGRISVTTGASCTWSAFSDVSWLQITSASSSGGTGALTYHAAANPSAARTGNLHIGPQVFSVTQQAAGPPPPQITDIKNSASFNPSAVSPGEIVSLFGSGLGPDTGVPLQLSDDGKSVTKSLGGVQVVFDGVPAALTYASARQINAVVPYSVAGNATTQVQVQYQGTNSNTMAMAVQDASPGIFTIDATGLGPGAILNQDYSVNSSVNRAARGQVVQIYCTGGGVTSPASVDGALTGTPLPMLTQPVSVTIGGILVAPPQLYSGGAPTAIAGLTQINVLIPANVTPGPALPVVVQIGTWQSQPGVTVGVK